MKSSSKSPREIIPDVSYIENGVEGTEDETPEGISQLHKILHGNKQMDHFKVSFSVSTLQHCTYLYTQNLTVICIVKHSVLV